MNKPESDSSGNTFGHGALEDHSDVFRSILLGFVRLHILNEASKEPIYGIGLLNSLAESGYKLSPGTLYPLLHSFEKANFLTKESVTVDGKVRKYYEITALGREVLLDTQGRLQRLTNDISGVASTD